MTGFSITSLEERLEYRKLKKEREKKYLSLTISMQDVEVILRETKGNYSRVAERMSTTRAVVRRYVETRPHLQRVMSEIREGIVDLAEEKLLEQVEVGNMAAITLVVKTFGKERGYSDKAILEHEFGEKAMKSAAALIEAMRRGSKSIEDKSTIEAEYTWEVVEPVPEK